MQRRQGKFAVADKQKQVASGKLSLMRIAHAYKTILHSIRMKFQVNS